jgi:hypothetical protein
MQIYQRVDQLGRREATTLATATTQRLFATLSSSSPATRQAVNLQNCDPAAELYITFALAGASAPTISSTDCDLILSPKASRTLQIGPGIDVWLRSSSSGTISYTALELQ